MFPGHAVGAPTVQTSGPSAGRRSDVGRPTPRGLRGVAVARVAAPRGGSGPWHEASSGSHDVRRARGVDAARRRARSRAPHEEIMRFPNAPRPFDPHLAAAAAEAGSSGADADRAPTAAPSWPPRAPSAQGLDPARCARCWVEVERKLAALEAAASTDPLTQLYNRRHFDRAGGRRARARAALRAGDVAGALRHRPLQAGQRPPRAPRGRPGARARGARHCARPFGPRTPPVGGAAKSSWC
jgi:hypothetical protein